MGRKLYDGLTLPEHARHSGAPYQTLHKRMLTHGEPFPPLLTPEAIAKRKRMAAAAEAQKHAERLVGEFRRPRSGAEGRARRAEDQCRPHTGSTEPTPKPAPPLEWPRPRPPSTDLMRTEA
jgi:hypothetical protein